MCCWAAPTSAAACGICSRAAAQRERQRALIAEAIGPIWEANHVWLILVVVLLFTCFPARLRALGDRAARAAHADARRHRAARLGVHLPHLRQHARRGAAPVGAHLLGRQRRHARRARRCACGGRAPVGRVPHRPHRVDSAARARSPSASSCRGWPRPSRGRWACSHWRSFAFLAATYLTVEARDAALREVFRRRALQTQGALLLLRPRATIVLARARCPAGIRRADAGQRGARHARRHRSRRQSRPSCALRRRRYQLARLAAVAQASFILWGWAWSQFPWLLPPDQTITGWPPRA